MREQGGGIRLCFSSPRSGREGGGANVAGGGSEVDDDGAVARGFSDRRRVVAAAGSSGEAVSASIVSRFVALPVLMYQT